MHNILEIVISLYLQGQGCKYNDKSKRVFLNQNQLQDNLPTAWDIEDLVNTCKGKKVDIEDLVNTCKGKKVDIEDLVNTCKGKKADIKDLAHEHM